jgi:hypothetical protein
VTSFDLPWMHGEWRQVVPMGEVVYGGRSYDLSNVTDLLDLQVIVGGAWEAVDDESEHPLVTAARAREADALARLEAAQIELAVTDVQADWTRAERFRSDIDRFHREYATGVVKPEGETRVPLTSIRGESGEVAALTHDLATPPTPTAENRADLIRDHRRRTGI